jgi:hypothetical protein
MNRNVAMQKNNNQPAIRFSDFGNTFTVLFRQFHKILWQLQNDASSFPGLNHFSM